MNFFFEQEELRTPVSQDFDLLDRKLSKNSCSYRFVTEIQPTDVLCGRGKTSFNHVGNRSFRDLIAESTQRYIDAKSRLQKSMVVHSIVEEVKKAQGRFLKQDRYSGQWFELDEKQAKEKVGHAIRDATSSIDPTKKMVKKRTSTAKSVMSEEKAVRPDSASSMSDDSSRSNASEDSSIPMDDFSNIDIEPIRHDSYEAKNSLTALHDDDMFLRRISAVLEPEVSLEEDDSVDAYTPLRMEIMQVAKGL